MSYTDSEIVGTVETATGETYRARIVQDIYAEEPEYDAGFPIVRTDFGRTGFSADMTSYGQCAEYSDGLPEPASDIITRFRERCAPYDTRTAIDTFERYLRIFHDGNLVEYGPNNATDYTYIAYVTRELWASWGNTGFPIGEANLDEYRAWIEGDVYGVIVEELTTWTKDGHPESTREEWKEIDSCYGFYGREYAEESAREQLEHFSTKA